MARLLLVDDDPRFLNVLRRLLEMREHTVIDVTDGEAALEALVAQSIDLVICDLCMKPMSGMDVLRTMHEKHPDIAVILITAYGTVETALEALKLGAYDYMTKPFDISKFVEIVENALNWRSRTNNALQGEIVVNYRLDNLIAESQAMQQVCTMIERIGATDATVLFHGERGVGKQLAGQTIHRMSRRRENPFLVADCAGKSEQELVSLLFGHLAGSFEGATEEHVGLFQLAEGGTIWLSEIGELPPDVQQRLLKVFRTHTIRPVGVSTDLTVNVRILAETSMNVRTAVSRGTFNADLFARFAPIAVEVKPLRARREDILPLAMHFLAQKMAKPTLAADVRRALLQYDWPGNIRELSDAMTQAAARAGNEPLTLEHLPANLVERVARGAGNTVPLGDDSGRASALKAFLRSKNTEFRGMQNQTQTKGTPS